MSSVPKVKPVDPHCTCIGCKRLARGTLRMWGKTYGPMCQPHLDEIGAEMAAFDERIDQKKDEIRAKRAKAEADGRGVA